MMFQNRDNIREWLAQAMQKVISGPADFQVAKVTILTHILALLINSTEAGNLLRGNDALHVMLGARRRARMQLVLVTMMFICLIA
jgi:hypothetical protein